MEFVPIDKILKTRPDTKKCIRKMYGFDKPGSMEEALRILQEWIEKQPHFNKKDFALKVRVSMPVEPPETSQFQTKTSFSGQKPFVFCPRPETDDFLPAELRCSPASHPVRVGDQYLESTIILNKGSIERAKSQLDKFCTMRTFMPQFFGKFNCKTDFEHLHQVTHSVLLPKLTEDHYRIFVTKFFDVGWESSQALLFFRHSLIMAEYGKFHDYVCGMAMVLDFSEASVLSFLTKLSPILTKQAMTVLIEGYGMRIKRIHIINDSKFVDGFVSLLKQVVSAKIASRINVHKSVEELHDFYPKDILPKDYGGEERSLKTLNDEWLDVLSSEEHLKYLEGMNKATTNESCRPKGQFFEQYAGMPGTFRFLSVD